MKRKPLFLYIFIPLSPFILLLLLETGFRAVEVLWKPVYRAVFDDSNKLHLYVLGESTAEGVQYRNKISPAVLLSAQFNDSLDGKPLEIISLAYSGETIEYNYFKFRFETIFFPHRNGLVFIYSGINECINNMDVQGFGRWKIIQHSIVLSKLLYMLNYFQNSPAKYEYRYRQVIEIAKKHGYKTIISQLVGNVADFDPDVSETDELFQPGFNKDFEILLAKFSARNYEQAENDCREMMRKLGHEHPYLLYVTGRCKYEEKQYDSARYYLNKSPEISVYNGYAAWKNNILSKVATEENVALAHTYDRFIDSSEYGLLGYNLINDAHHPNLKGYYILSRELAKAAGKLYNEPIKQTISPETVAAKFKFDSAFYADVYTALTEWFIYKTFDTKIRDARIGRLQYYMSQYESYKPGDELPEIWKLFVAVLRNQPEDFMNHLRKIGNSPRKEELFKRFMEGCNHTPKKEAIRKTIMAWELPSKSDSLLRKELLGY